MPLSGALVREIRTILAISQQELAVAIGVSAGTVHCWETGKHDIRISHKIAIKEFLESRVAND